MGGEGGCERGHAEYDCAAVVASALPRRQDWSAHSWGVTKWQGASASSEVDQERTDSRRSGAMGRAAGQN
eukprot:14533004-Alexandrium_andersonii.AAC.1